MKRSGGLIPGLLILGLTILSQGAYGQATDSPSPATNAAAPASPKKAVEGASKPKAGFEGLDPVLRRVRQLSDELRSPFCPGKTLMTCTSSQAFDLRREMETMVRSGKTNKEIIVELKKKYGDEVSNPQQPWYTFFVPFLPFIVLAGLLFWVVRRWRRGDQETIVGSADLNSEIVVDSGSVEDVERLERLRARLRQDDQ